MTRFLNTLSVIAVIILIATGLRTIVYWFIGLSTERIFRTELLVIWGIAVLILIVRYLKNK